MAVTARIQRCHEFRMPAYGPECYERRPVHEKKLLFMGRIYTDAGSRTCAP